MHEDDLLSGRAPNRMVLPPRRNFRVLHVAEVIKGGICTHLRELVELQRRSFGADRITLVIPASQADELRAPAGVRIVRFRDSSNRIINACRAAVSVYLQLQQQPLDVVHVHSTFAGAVVRPLLALLRARPSVIFCPHGWAFFRDMVPWKRRLVERFERQWSRWCRTIVCVSRHERMAAVQVGIASTRLVVVPNGLPQVAPEPAPLAISWPPGARRLLFVGRFDRQKGIDILFEALRQLGGAAFACIAGDSLYTALGSLPVNARYAGWLDTAGLEAYYRSAEVIVMPSRWEGFPLVALEAMRAGLPIIASAVGGLPEIVDDGETGLLIPPNDASALVDAVRSLSPARLQYMASTSAERFSRRWTAEAVHRSMSELYRRSLRKQEAAAVSWELDFGTRRPGLFGGRAATGS
jgi:glycosyltransferase involved in cell wall biosynthesis